MKRKNNNTDKVVLVDSHDREIGIMPKLEAHEKGVLHRAFSVFLFNYKGQMLLQQRADEKYHSAGLWSNTCCSHPLPGENVSDAAKRRLREEMGISCNLNSAFNFIYKVDFSNGLTEHEFDHVLLGIYNEAPEVNPEEVKDWKYVHVEELILDMRLNPDNYTAWFKICIEKVILHLKNKSFVKAA